MAAEDTLFRITLAIIVGTLGAIVYSLRVLVLMERRVAKIETHIDRVVQKVLKEEKSIKRAITRRASTRKTKRKAKRTVKRKKRR